MIETGDVLNRSTDGEKVDPEFVESLFWRPLTARSRRSFKMKAKNLSLECIYHAAELQFTCIALPDKIAFFLIQRNHDFSPEFKDFLDNIRKANAQ